MFPPPTHQFSARELVNLYVEFEKLRRADGRPESSLPIVRETARYLGVTVLASEATIQATLDTVEEPHLDKDAFSAISSLIERG